MTKKPLTNLKKGDIILGPADDRPIGDLFYCSRPNLNQKFRQYKVVKDDEEKTNEQRTENLRHMHSI